MEDKLLSVDQVAQYLAVHRDTVYAMIRSGKLAAFQLGGRKASWRISEADLQRFIDERRSEFDDSRGAGEPSDRARREEALRVFDDGQKAELDAFRESQADRRAEFRAGRDDRAGQTSKNGSQG